MLQSPTSNVNDKSNIVDSTTSETKEDFFILTKDLASTLENLGFKDRQINSAIKFIKQSHRKENLENMIKLSLDFLRKHKKTPQEILNKTKSSTIDIQKIFWIKTAEKFLHN